MSYVELERQLQKAQHHLNKSLELSAQLGKRGREEQKGVGALWQFQLERMMKEARRLEKEHQIHFMNWINWWKIIKK